MARRTRRTFGGIRKLPSGRYQAYYTGPDGKRRSAPSTFTRERAASAWLAAQEAAMARGEWQDQMQARRQRVTFADYAAEWLAARRLADRTRHDYQKLLDLRLLPAFGSVPVAAIKRETVADWYTSQEIKPGGGRNGESGRAHAYRLLHAIMATAVSENLLPVSPCQISGGGREHPGQRHPATPQEVESIAAAMPPRLALLVQLAAWCGLRWGEVTELRRADLHLDSYRGDLHLDSGTVTISRGVVRIGGGGTIRVKGPKSEAGRRTITIPSHLMPAVRAHLEARVPPASDALLFTATRSDAQHLDPSGFRKHWARATAAAGRPGLTFHDLRHTGLTYYAQAGATTAELMARGGHSSPDAVQRYQHAVRDRQLAEAMSLLATGEVVPLRRK